METERKIHLNEDHPLNSTGATKIYVNAGKCRKLNSPNDGTVIHLNTDKQAELGVHLNTTLSIASSKKIKLLFLLNFLLSLVCMVLCFCVACYYWHELSALRRQIDTMKDHLLIKKLNQEMMQSPLVRLEQPPAERDTREPRTAPTDNSQSQSGQKFYVENLGPDLLFVDTKKKNESHAQLSTNYLATIQKDLVIVQFNGDRAERDMGSDNLIGPWKRDVTVSSKNSDKIIEMNSTPDHVVIKESGLYLVYAQVAYLSHAPSCYYVWARQAGDKPRILTMCATGDDSTARSLDKAQISCASQAVARLLAGDIVTVSQREKNRTLLLRPGYSYFGFVKLAP